MSVKEYFAHPTIKNKVLEFLKSKGDFVYLHQKHKRPFRAYITETDNDFFVSDDYNQIKCVFSQQCQERFAERYPGSIDCKKVANMLVCLQEYQLILKDAEGNLDNTRISKLKLGSKIDVIMQIEDLQVISFDKFNFKVSQSVEYDENIRIHMNFVIHFLSKKSIIEETKVREAAFNGFKNNQLATTKGFLDNQVQLITKSRQQALDQQRIQAQKPQNSGSPQRNTKPKAEAPPAPVSSSQIVTFDYFKDDEVPKPLNLSTPPDNNKNIIKYKGELSSAEKEHRKVFKRLKGLNSDKIQEDGFLSCSSSLDIKMIDCLQPDQEEQKVQRALKQGVTYTQLDRDEKLQEIDEAMEDFLDDLDIPENEETPIEKIAATLKPFEEPQVIQQSLQEVLGVSSDVDEEDICEEPAVKIELMSQRFDLRKQEELISNPSSILENEILQREQEEKDNLGKIQIQSPDIPVPIQGTASSKIDFIGTGLKNTENQKQIIEARKKLRQQVEKPEYIGSQDDLLNILDTNPPPLDKQGSIFDKKVSQHSEASPVKPSPVKTSPAKNPSTTKQASLFSFMKKREQKEESKKAVSVAEICSQNSQKLLNSQSKFNKFTEWTKNHEVVKVASPGKQETHTEKSNGIDSKKEPAKKDTKEAKKEPIKETPKDKKQPTKKTEPVQKEDEKIKKPLESTAKPSKTEKEEPKIPVKKTQKGAPKPELEPTPPASKRARTSK